MQTRRDALTMLLSSIPMISLSACSGKSGDEPDPDTTPETSSETIVRPTLDTDRLLTGLTAALADSPWADQIETMVAGAAAQIEALREAGYDDSADLATNGLNGIVGNIAAGFGEGLAARGTDAPDFTALSEEMIGELATTCIAMRASLPGATAEISKALGGDAVPGDAEAATAMVEYEADIREMMYEKGLSGQGGMGLLLYQLQTSRAGVTEGVSLGSASSSLDSALSGMASDADVDAFSAQTIRRIVHRQLHRGPPPPGDLSELCDVIAWVSFFTGWMGAIHKAVGETAEKMATFVDELPEAYEYLKASWTTWLAQDLTDEVLEQTEAAVLDAIKGKAGKVTAEQCNQIAAFIIVVLWFVSLIATLIAFMQAITWLAGTLGAFTPGGTVALVFILMLVMILYYTLEMVCAVIGILPTLNIMFGECGE